MNRSMDAQLVQLDLRAAYEIPALAKLAKMTRQRIRRLLKSHGARFLRSGRIVLVPLVDCEEKVPLLRKSMRLLEGLQQAREQRAPTVEGGGRRGSPAQRLWSLAQPL